MPKKLHIANLSRDVNEAELLRLFGCYGVHVAKIFEPLTSTCATAAGVVEVDTEQNANSAIAALNGTLYHGWLLKVEWAQPVWSENGDTCTMFRSADTQNSGAIAAGEPRGPRPGDFGDRGGGA